jgi:hypothetical protein
MYDPAPFRLSLPQARALKVGVITCTVLAGLAFVSGTIYALAYGDWRHLGNATLAGSVLLGLLGLGLYIRRALALAHQRQLTTIAWLVDPHTGELSSDVVDQAHAPDAEIPSPRPSADPETAREDERG